MNVGDKVWVILQGSDDGLMIAQPELPQSGCIVAIEETLTGQEYCVHVDNDTLYLYQSNIFESEDQARQDWIDRMENIRRFVQRRISSVLYWSSLEEK